MTPDEFTAEAMAELGVISRPNCGWKPTFKMVHSHSYQVSTGCLQRDLMTTWPPVCPQTWLPQKGQSRRGPDRSHRLFYLVSEVTHHRCNLSLLFIQVTPLSLVSVGGDTRGCEYQEVGLPGESWRLATVVMETFLCREDRADIHLLIALG